MIMGDRTQNANTAFPAGGNGRICRSGTTESDHRRILKSIAVAMECARRTRQRYTDMLNGVGHA